MTINSRSGLLAGGLALVAVVGGVAWYHSEHTSSAPAAGLYNASNPNPSYNDPNYNPNTGPGGANNNTGAYGSGNYVASGSAHGGYAGSGPGGYNSTGNGYNQNNSGYAQNGGYDRTRTGVYEATSANYNSGAYAVNDGYNSQGGYNTAPYVSGRYIQSIQRPVRVYYPPQVNTVRQETVYEDRPGRVYNNHYVERTVVYDRHHRRSTKKSVAIVAGSAAGGALIGGLAGGGTGAAIGALAGGGAGFIYDRMTHNR
jgi:hypothetical protein